MKWNQATEWKRLNKSKRKRERERRKRTLDFEISNGTRCLIPLTLCIVISCDAMCCVHCVQYKCVLTHFVVKLFHCDALHSGIYRCVFSSLVFFSTLFLMSISRLLWIFSHWSSSLYYFSFFFVIFLISSLIFSFLSWLLSVFDSLLSACVCISFDELGFFFTSSLHSTSFNSISSHPL